MTRLKDLVETLKEDTETFDPEDICSGCKLPWSKHPEQCLLRDCEIDGPHCHQYGDVK